MRPSMPDSLCRLPALRDDLLTGRAQLAAQELVDLLSTRRTVARDSVLRHPDQRHHPILPHEHVYSISLSLLFSVK
jgi:hypothetical protein